MLTKKILITLLSVLVVYSPATIIWASAPPSRGISASPMKLISEGRSSKVEAKNGFKAQHRHAVFSDEEGRSINGGSLTVSSPWGETMEVKYFVEGNTLALDLGKGLRVAHTFDSYGRPLDMFVEQNGKAYHSFVGNLKSDFRKGHIMTWASPEVAGYLALSRGLSNNHTPDFLYGLEELGSEDMTIQAGCWFASLACSASLLAYIGGLAVLISTCGAAGVGTNGLITLACGGMVVAELGISLTSIGACGLFANCVLTHLYGSGSPDADVDETPAPGDDPADSPIILDLTGNGYHLSGPNPPVFFDLDADGEAEPLSWTGVVEPDAFLCLDDNQNGTIDNGAELFGNHTVLSTGERAEHGFEALSEYDLPEFGGNGDGKISAADWVYSMLCVWTDANRDGVSHSSELQDLGSAGVISIDCDYTESGKHDSYGNEFQYKGKARILNPAGNPKVVPIYDVFFVSPQ